jgi:hypothetical protein
MSCAWARIGPHVAAMSPGAGKNWSDAIDPKRRAELEQYAQEGKGVFVPRKLLLRPGLRHGGFVDVGALRFIALHQPLLRHDLQQLQHGGVLRGPSRQKRFVNLQHGAAAAAPKHCQDFQFAVGRSR